MKKIYTFIILLSLGFTANAAIHNVAVSSNSFTPSSIPTVTVGDTIRWTLAGGTHTTSSVTIPNGASSWNYTFSGLGDSFDYKVTVAGNYSYKCNFHGTMTASFVAVSATATVNELENSSSLKAYPNPFKSKLTVPNKTATSIEIMNVLGERVKVFSVNDADKATVLDLSDLKKGVYFYVLKDQNTILETRKVIKSE